MRTRPHHRLLLFMTSVAIAATGYVAPPPALAAEPQFTITGGGWGHGIGLSQYGARGYALQGWSAEKIVTHYFQGTKIVTKDTAPLRPQVNLDVAGGSRSQWLIKAGVGTSGKASKLSVKLRGVENHDATQMIDLDATNPYWIVTSGGKVRVYTNKVVSSKNTPSDLLKEFPGSVYATAGGTKGFVQIVDKSGPYSHLGVTWRGTIHFVPTSATSNTSRAINWVHLEEYLYGVVPRESPSGWPAAALQAQAIVARSYAYQDAVKGTVLRCTAYSQVYNGYKGPSGGEMKPTNDAVDKTKGMVVWYGSETQPVKTYFSSSSGGHTANVEDVWGSAPKPYYKGVPDADKDTNPYYTWTAGVYTGSSLAAKIRGHSNTSSAAAPAPATITKVLVGSASTGHARTVTLTWSNGKVSTVRGDNFRAALGLRSTRFKVGAANGAAAASTIYSNENAKLGWLGPWKLAKNTVYRGGSMYTSATKNAKIRISFNGTGFRWIASKGPGYGKAKVYVDGKLVKTVDLYASKTSHRQTVYSNKSLKNSKHTVTVMVTGTKNAKSSAKTVGFDGIEIYGGTLQKRTADLTRYQQNNKNVAKLGSWSTLKSSANYSGGSILRTDKAGARFYATFYGSEIRWIGTKGQTYGRARVSIDGGKPQEIALTGPTSYQKVLFSKTGLSQDKAHTIMIEAVGPKSGGLGRISVDAIEVRGGWLLPVAIPPVTVQQSDTSVKWKGKWATTRSSKFSGGTHKWSSTKNASAKITFEGTQVALVGKKGPKYGKAFIYLDGKRVATIDQFASKTSYRKELWKSGRLAAKKHTLEIRVARQRRSGAKGYIVGVDAFKVAGRAVK